MPGGAKGLTPAYPADPAGGGGTASPDGHEVVCPHAARWLYPLASSAEGENVWACGWQLGHLRNTGGVPDQHLSHHPLEQWRHPCN